MGGGEEGTEGGRGNLREEEERGGEGYTRKWRRGEVAPYVR